MSPQINLRAATPADSQVIFELISELAAYEREPDAVQTTPQTIRAQLTSDRCPFECIIAERFAPETGERVAVGFALFFQNYSTWKGRPGLYLEDLFVRESARKLGVGKALLKELGRIACEREYARMEWSVLDWNRLAIDFYEALGATPMSEWTTFRLTGAALTKLGS